MDLVDSRKIEHRELVQKKLMVYLTHLNTQYASSLAAPIALILGDEWMIVLREIHLVYEIYLKIRGFLIQNELEAYAGVGFGMLEGDFTDVRKLHGRALEEAAKSMRVAKSSKYAYKKDIPTKHCSVFLTGYPMLDSELDVYKILNQLIQNNEILLSRVTKKQENLIQLYEQYDSYSRIIKVYPEITKRMLSDCLNTAQYWMMKRNRHMIEQLLSDVKDQYSTNTVV